MSTSQAKNESKRLQVLMPPSLMRHIEKRVGLTGLYANASDYLRDLVRRDAQAEPGLQQHLDAVWEILMPGAMAAESEITPYTLEEILERNGLKAVS